MTILIILFTLIFAALSLAPVLVDNDRNAKAGIILAE